MSKTIGIVAGICLLTGAYLTIAPYKTVREIKPGVVRTDIEPQRLFFGLAGTIPGKTIIEDRNRYSTPGSNQYIAKQTWADVNGNGTLDTFTRTECVNMPSSVGDRCYENVEEFLRNSHINQTVVMRKNGQYEEHGKLSGYGQRKQEQFKALLSL
jgi:hypothetical protein